jgi:hypothetical protein
MGEFDDENGVLARQTNQDDQSDLGEDVIVGAVEPDPGHGE